MELRFSIVRGNRGRRPLLVRPSSGAIAVKSIAQQALHRFYLLLISFTGIWSHGQT